MSKQKRENNKHLPEYLQPFLWSYDLMQMDIEKHKKIIIKNILDFGTREATDWLKDNYSKKDIQEIIESSYSSDWSKKSLNFWSLIYGVQPKQLTRF